MAQKDVKKVECCDIKLFGVLIDPESKEEYLAPLHANYCPVCGTPLLVHAAG
ncbi:hypothetical protein [Oryzomonas sagensis]|uniref:hypothetical protein n=1 Tax=Oryzomonas sagensis TaxID=2603857 RepID=UPI00177B0387|nr:hypothetical protein [Oryzomonas sagensis]